MDQPSRYKSVICLIFGVAVGFGLSIPYVQYSAHPFHVGVWSGGSGTGSGARTKLLYRYDKRTGETWYASHGSSIRPRWRSVPGGS